MNERGAFVLAQLAHEGQLYERNIGHREEVDYFGFHVLGVVKLVKAYLQTTDTYNERKSLDIIIATYLHDVVEDTWLTLDDVLNLGINMDIYYILDALTKRPDKETYLEYIARCKRVPTAKLIKTMDINFNLSHLCVGDSLEKRYKKALDILAE